MSADRKLARASAHLAELREAAARFRAELADVLVDRSIAPDGSIEYRMRTLPPPPDGLALSLGDFLQNTRAALDHAVYALSTVTRPDYEQTGFPIVLTEANYADAERRLLPYVRTEAREVIRQFQPFAWGAGEHDLFLVLHRLAIIDRHRTITLLANVVGVQHVSWSRMDPRDDDPGIQMYRPGIAPGDLVLRLPSVDAEPSATFEPFFQAAIVVGEGDRLSARHEVVDLAGDIYARAQAAVVALQRLA